MIDLTKEISCVILDFYREKESRVLLESLKENLKFKCDIVFYDNGTPDNYSEKFLEEGLITKLIKQEKNRGCGPATAHIYEMATTPFVLYLQCDHELVEPLHGEQIMNAIQWLRDGIFHCIDMAGNQGQGRFSERANIMGVDFYNKIPKGSLGGPGITNDEKYVEEWVQDYFSENDCRIAHIQPTFFADRGYYSVRQLADDDLCTIHSCYSKEIWRMTNEIPKRRYDIFPPLNDNEWHRFDELIPVWKTGKRGYIPESQVPHSFTNPQIEEMIERDVCPN
jgi:glycosyltransferase involved in cell wall biosynthesis